MMSSGQHDHAGQSLQRARARRDRPLPHGLRDRRGARHGARHGARWSNGATVVASILLAFVFGYGLTSVPLVRSGLPVGRVAPLAFASDTLSLTTMEIVDTLIVLIIPGALDAGLTDPLFWASLVAALLLAGAAAYPVNRHLIARGKGHAVIHDYH